MYLDHHTHLVMALLIVEREIPAASAAVFVSNFFQSNNALNKYSRLDNDNIGVRLSTYAFNLSYEIGI